MDSGPPGPDGADRPTKRRVFRIGKLGKNRLGIRLDGHGNQLLGGGRESGFKTALLNQRRREWSDLDNYNVRALRQWLEKVDRMKYGTRPNLVKKPNYAP